MIYLAADLITFIVWVFLLIRRFDLRHEMIVSGLAAIPISFFDYLTRPYFWNPPTLFNLPIGIETIIFNFLLGGIAASIYEEVYGRKLIRIRLRDRGFKSLRYALFIFLLISIFLFSLAFRDQALLLGFAGMFSGILLIVAFRRDLIPNVIFSGLLFGLLYLVIFALWISLFPRAISWWNLEFLSGRLILGVPIEQMLFALLYGSFWGPLYEYLQGYRLDKA